MPWEMFCFALSTRVLRKGVTESYSVAPFMTVSDSYPTFVTARGVVPNAAVPAAGSNVNSASFRTIDVRVTRLPFPTPTDTTAVAAVLTKTPEYQTTASTSATIMQPPQRPPVKDDDSTAGTAVARSAGGAVTGLMSALADV